LLCVGCVFFHPPKSSSSSGKKVARVFSFLLSFKEASQPSINGSRVLDLWTEKLIY
jgi:hypothetical protein